MPRSWRPEVQTDGTGQWYGNALRFATMMEAEENAFDLAMRWTRVRNWRAAASDDEPTHRWDDALGWPRGLTELEK